MSLGHKLWVTESRLQTVFPDEELVTMEILFKPWVKVSASFGLDFARSTSDFPIEFFSPLLLINPRA